MTLARLVLAFFFVTAAVPAAVRAQGVLDAVPTQRIPGARFEALAARAVARLPHDAEIEYRPAMPVPDQIVQAGAIRLTTEAPLRTPAYVNVPIRISVDGRYVRTLFVGYRVQRYVRTAVAARDLAPGTVLSADDLAMERIPYNGEPPNGIAVLVGRKVLGPVSKGQPIYTAETEADQLVKAGSTVVFIVRDSGVTLVADVIARTGGALGDVVSVYDQSTNKTLTGTVVGPNRVELDISTGGE